MIKKGIKNWELNPEEYPEQGSIEEKIRFILRYGILAPSTHNSQPWNFIVKSNVCQVFFDKKLLLPNTDPVRRDLFISLGALLANIETAWQYFGLSGEVKYLWQDNLIVQIKFSESSGREERLAKKISAITNRVNTRGVFLPRRLETDKVKEIFSVYSDQEVTVHLLTDDNKIRRVAELTSRGMIKAHADKNFRREMSKWMHNNFSCRLDGLPGYALKMPTLLSFIVPVLLPYLNLGKILGILNKKSIISAPGVAIITSDQDSPRSWMSVGRAYEFINLDLVSRGLQTSVYVAAIEKGDVREQLQEILASRQLPQFLFCLGYVGGNLRHTPRHPLEVKIID